MCNIQPPTLTLLEIGDLSTERFRGIFRLGYQGDAWIEVKCRVQANPLSHNPHLSASSTLPMSTPLLASQPLLVPMTLRLSSLNLRAILILVISKSKGITLVFKNDPLQNVDVSSTFDSIEVIRGYLQQEIEGQLKELFREDLPEIIHRLSQKWFGGAGMSGKVEMPYREDSIRVDRNESSINVSGSSKMHPSDPSFPDQASSSPTRYRRPLVDDTLTPDDSISVSPTRRLRSSITKKRSNIGGGTSESPTSYTTFPEYEQYDPTYGLRPESLPTHSGYEAFGKLWQDARNGKNKGLGSLMKLAEEITFVEADEADSDGIDDRLLGSDNETMFAQSDDGMDSVDAVDASPSLRAVNQRRSQYSERLRPLSGHSLFAASDIAKAQPTWDTESNGNAHATRPRIFLVQSQIRAPSESGMRGGGGGNGMMPSPSGTIKGMTPGSLTARASSIRGRASSVRSSAGASSVVGLGTSRMLMDGPNGRIWPRRSVPPQFRPSSPSPHSTLSPPLPASVPPPQSMPLQTLRDRSHSRSTSIPLNPIHRTRGPSKLSSAVPRSHAASTAAINSSHQLQQQHPVRPPRSVQDYPVASRDIVTPPRIRQASVSHPLAGISSGSPPTMNHHHHHHPLNFSQHTVRRDGIVLPLNDSVSQLASLSHSNHTMSPYARSYDHIAVRSFPHLSRANSLTATAQTLSHHKSAAPGFMGDQTNNMHRPRSPRSTHHAWHLDKVQARQKRIYHIGGASKKTRTSQDEQPGMQASEDQVFSPA